MISTGCSKSSATSVRIPPTSTTPPPSPAVPGSAKLSWDGSFSAPGVLDPSVTGYRLYYGTASRDYTEAVDAGLTYEIAVAGLPRTRVYFALTAYNASGMESEFSDEVSGDLSANPTAAISIAPAK